MVLANGAYLKITIAGNLDGRSIASQLTLTVLKSQIDMDSTYFRLLF